MKIISIGEILWDVFPDGERLGGAPFNLAAHLHKLGHDVAFVSAVGDDERGRKALARMKELGLSTAFVTVHRSLPTGHVTIRLKRGQPDYTIHRPAAYDAVQAPPAGVGADWICYGTLLAANMDARSALLKTISDNPEARRFYDVNLRRDSWSPWVVSELLDLADVVKVNEEEARTLKLKSRDNICITRGERGCLLRFGGRTVEVPGVPVQVADAVGAGDAWAAAFLHGFSLGWDLERVGAFANHLGALVASRPGAIPDWDVSELEASL